MRQKTKRVATDALGYLCILLSALLGWLPGPGGTPLLLLGLGLLSIHNPWAKRLLHFVREHSDRLREIVFPDKKPIQLAWDGLALAIFVLAIYLSSTADGLILKGVGVMSYTVALVIFLFNRHRLRWLEKFKLKKK